MARKHGLSRRFPSSCDSCEVPCARSIDRPESSRFAPGVPLDGRASQAGNARGDEVPGVEGGS